MEVSSVESSVGCLGLVECFLGGRCLPELEAVVNLLHCAAVQ